MNQQPNNPLHGLTLEKIVTQLYERYGWDGFKSSLKFLRKTQWARDKVEQLYIQTFHDVSKRDDE